MPRTKNTVYRDGRVEPTPPFTPESRAAQLATGNRIAGAAPGSIASRALHNATLDNAFAINPTTDEIEYEDDTNTKDENGHNNANGSNREADVNGGDENNSDATDEDEEFYRAHC